MFESLFFFWFPLYSSSSCYHLALERLSEKKTNFGRRVWWYLKIVRNKALRKIYIYGMRHGGASRSVNIAQQPSRLLEWKLRVWCLWMKKQAAFVNSCKMVWTNRLRSFEEIERKRGYCERMFVVNWTNGSRNGWGNSAANAFTTLYQHAVWFFRICRSSIHGHQYISLMPEYTMCAFVFRPVQLYIERSLLECRMYICAFSVWQST